MPKQGKRKIRQCVYCGTFAEISKDHVIPECLFRKPYPLNLITVPACDVCNYAKSLNDDFLRDLLTTDVFGNQSPAAQEVFFDTVLRSARKGTSDIAETLLARGREEPFFTRAGIYLGHLPSAPVDPERVQTIFSTIVRGLFYDARRQRIPDNYVFEVRRYHPWDFKEVWQEAQRLNLNGPRVLGNVFGCAFASAQEDPCTTLWYMWFYERVFFSVSAINPAYEAETTPAA